MYGGLVMPSRSMHEPSVGSAMVRSRNRRVTSVPRSMPYAPVSSELSQISVTPSATAVATRAANASGAYEPRSPRACLVLQYVHAPRHPVLSGKISTCEFRRTFGRSRLGSAFFSSNRTACPSSVRSTTSTMRSICVTPTTLRPSSSRAFLSPCGTHPATTSRLSARFALAMVVFIADWLGFFTVHVFTTHTSAASGSSLTSYPYAPSWPAMNSESLTLCEHPNVFTCTTPRPGMEKPGASRSRSRRAVKVAAAESLVASPKLSEARTESSSTSSTPLDAGLAAPDPARARTFTTGGRSLVTRAPSAANAPPRSSRSSRSAILPLPALSLALPALPRLLRDSSPPPSLAARSMRGNAARASLVTAQATPADTPFSSRLAQSSDGIFLSSPVASVHARFCVRPAVQDSHLVTRRFWVSNVPASRDEKSASPAKNLDRFFSALVSGNRDARMTQERGFISP